MLQFIVPLFNDLMIWSMTEWNSLYNTEFQSKYKWKKFQLQVSEEQQAEIMETTFGAQN